MSALLKPIREIADQLDIAEDHLQYYGKFTAKLDLALLDGNRPVRGKLILVTAITPTSHGEGKTVVSIGLAQGFARTGRRAVVTLREPSLGPVFGLKGGATGGGRSQVIPSEMINLHFNGDFHAVTSAHNLLAAMLDSHLHHGNALGIDVDNIFWPRALDMNDRALRHIIVGLGGKADGIPRETGFVITAASEVMAVLALAASREDLRRRLSDIVVGLTLDRQPVRAGDLKATGAMMVLLNEAIMPNLVQTTEHTPAIIHAGPFGNIAHGTSSVIAQKMGLQLADWVINETGFAADLGAEKYMDLVMPSSGLKPSAAVLIASVRGLEAQGGGSLTAGFANLDKHLDNLAAFGLPVVVALNRFASDSDEDLAMIRAHCRERGVEAVEADVFARGGEGAVDLAEAVVNAASLPVCPKPLYEPEVPLEEKICAVACRIYGAAGVYFESGSRKKLQQYAALGFGRLPVCMAKTQSSLSDNPKLLGAPSGFTLTVTDVHLSAGAGFLVVIAGNMLRMPGLGKDPQAAHMDVNEAGEIVGLV
ncbi:MAG: formate--tetrahydrofolate ligase [Bryobacterales bacterium]|nr:formate--tetrahydrofolate ligase [Bryobacterales bacterium]